VNLWPASSIRATTRETHYGRSYRSQTIVTCKWHGAEIEEERVEKPATDVAWYNQANDIPQQS